MNTDQRVDLRELHLFTSVPDTIFVQLMSGTESRLEQLAIEQETLNVTRSFLPPMEEYVTLLERIWESGWLTNFGPFMMEFERNLREHLGSQGLIVVNNGTVALQIAIKAMGIKGEVITTPFSYVATTSSLVWENCVPRFADIDPATFNIDPKRIEEQITSDTSAILATHVFGMPCDVEAIEAIAQKHGLKVIYDGAHAFGVNYKGRSLVRYGDACTLSFHATKLMHSIEGGAIISEDDELVSKFRYMGNFGHKGQEDFHGLGINGKMSEFHAAMGVLNLRHLSEITLPREKAWNYYAEGINGLPGITIQSVPEGTERNNAYFPVVFESEEQLLHSRSLMNADSIHPRRYFFPALSELPYVHGDCPVAGSVSRRILCLPLYSGIPHAAQDRVLNALERSLT